jgi:hypothetical protein
MSIDFFGAALAPTKISKYFTLEDLTQTSTGVKNIVTPEARANLTRLAAVLDTLYDSIGPFRVISGYRSAAVQEAIKGGAAGAASAAQAASKSFHSLGMAADIVPSTKSANQYLADIAANPQIKNLLGEIAIKSGGLPIDKTGNTLHVSLATPSKQGVLMYVDQAGNYIRMAASEVSAFLDKYKKPIVVAGSILLPAGILLAAWFYARRLRK